MTKDENAKGLAALACHPNPSTAKTLGHSEPENGGWREGSATATLK